MSLTSALTRRQVLLGACSALPARSLLAVNRFHAVPLQRRITRVQPWTGLVLWTDHEHVATDAVQLEFSYLRYDQVAKSQNRYDWSRLDRLLDASAGRRHQAIVRFWDAYPGRSTCLPAFVKKARGYRERRARSEGKATSFPDWSHPALKGFLLDFYARFAARYDRDPRLAYLQVGFGLWSEYHIYDGPMVLGQTFPDLAYQSAFAQALATHFQHLPWMISIDAADPAVAPFAASSELRALPFGVFDDSFLHRRHDEWNAPNWTALGRHRWQTTPAGGELSYFENDQEHVLDPEGPHGVSFEQAAADYHISFMIANDQPERHPWARIQQAGMACGYRIRLARLISNGAELRGIATNTGIAPPYHDLYFAAGSTRSQESLKGLLPGAQRAFRLPTPNAQDLRLESPRLVPGQQLEFEADLAG